MTDKPKKRPDGVKLSHKSGEQVPSADPGKCPEQTGVVNEWAFTEGADACDEFADTEVDLSESVSSEVMSACLVEEGGLGEVDWREFLEGMTEEDLRKRFLSIRLEDGETYTQKAQRLNDYFYSDRVRSYVKARKVVEKHISSEASGDRLELENVASRVHENILFSSTNLGQRKEKGGIAESFRQAYASVLDSLGFCFRKVPAYNDRNGFNDLTALKNARILREQDLQAMGIFNMGDPQEALRLRYLSCKAKHVAGKTENGHRLAYFLDQAATYLGNGVGVQRDVPALGRGLSPGAMPGEDGTMTVPAPSIPLFEDCDEGKDEVREYIESMLSLLFPDKGRKANLRKGLLNQEEGDFADLVQEEFITTDLMALAQEHGIYDEYSQVFEDLFYYRQMQFHVRFHLFPPCPPKGRESEKKISLLDVLKELRQKKGGKGLLKVASLGPGKGSMEKFLASLGCEVVGVDVSGDIDDDEVEERDGLTLIRLSTKNEVEKTIGNRIGKVFKFFKKHLKGSGEEGAPDLVMAGDSLHETEDPGAYFRALYEFLGKEGIMYVTDPAHSQVLDGVSSVSTLTLDSTRTPSILFSIENYFENIAYLTLKGAKVLGISIVPGTFAGYFDPFWRSGIVLHKSGEAPIYDVRGPKSAERGAYIESYEEVYQTVPFCLLDAKQRGLLESRLGREKIFPGANLIRFRDLRAHVVGLITEEVGILPAAGEAGRDIARKTPFGSYIEKLLNKLNIGDSDLRDRNRKAGEVVRTRELLSIIGIDINLTELDGWTIDLG